MLNAISQIRGRIEAAPKERWNAPRGLTPNRTELDRRAAMQSTHCLFPECDKPKKGAGYCSGHYKQKSLGRTLTPLLVHIRGTRRDKLDARTDRSGECWLWTGSLNKHGYGTACFDGMTTMAHRASYAEAFGPIPKDTYLDHICRNPACVRPEHLRPVDSKRNQENRSQISRMSSSGYRGVSWYPRLQKWRTTVKHDGRQYTAGLFEDREEAHRAIIALRNTLYTHNDLDRTGSDD